MDANEKFSMKEYKRNYYLKNREKIRQKVKEKMKTPEFKEKRKKYLEKYYEENGERVKKMRKENYVKNNYAVKKSEYDKKYREENKEKIFFIKKNYRERFKEEISKKKKKYRGDNEDILRNKRLKYLEENKESIKTRKLKDRVKNWVHNLYKSADNKNKRTYKITTDFTEEYILELYNKQDGKCHWYGIPLISSDVFKYPLKPSLDRKDNNKGYTKDNIVLCSLMSNLGRNSCDVKIWEEVIKAIKDKSFSSIF